MKPAHFATAILAGAILTTPAYSDEQDYDFDGFNSLHVSAGVETIVTSGRAFSVRAESTRRGLSMLEIDQRGDRLTIGRDSSWSGLNLLRSAPEITVYVTLPELVEVSASSGSSIAADGGKYGDRFVGSASSGASVDLRDLSGRFISLEASSGASVHVSGICENLNAEASSGASLNASALQCDSVDAEASSGASLMVHARDAIESDASSGASIIVGGRPNHVDAEDSSGGSVVVSN